MSCNLLITNMNTIQTARLRWVLAVLFITGLLSIFITRWVLISGHMNTFCTTTHHGAPSETFLASRDAHRDAMASLQRERDDIVQREEVLKASLSTRDAENKELEDKYQKLQQQIDIIEKQKNEKITQESDRVKTALEKDMLATKRGYMKSVMEADLLLLRSMLTKYRKYMDEEWEAMLSGQKERGILVVAGEPKYMLNAFVSLWPIRHYWNSSLPICVSYWGKTENVSTQTMEFFNTHIGDVSFVDLSDATLAWPAHQRSLFLKNQQSGRLGWVLKLAAVYFAPFQEVLYLDADSSPISNPDKLFSLKEYEETGALFWPDTPCSRPNLFEQLIEMDLIEEQDAPKLGEHETESGQWLLNRRIHREPIEFMVAMGSHSDFTFSYAFGDKDLFRAGFALAGEADSYSLISKTLGFAWSAATANGERTMRGYIQFSSHGEPLFHHRAGWKTKYEFNPKEERDLDSISSPLSCEWLRRYWPMKYPGVLANDELHEITSDTCSYSLGEFDKAVHQCGTEFTGKPDERIPLFSIKDSHIEKVHNAINTAWEIALQGRRESNDRLFSVQAT